MTATKGDFTTNTTVWFTSLKGGDASGNGMFRTLLAAGTFGGATLYIHVRDSEGTSIRLATLTLATAGAVNFQLRGPAIGVCCTGGSSHDIHWEIH